MVDNYYFNMRKKIKINQELLNEELKKFKLLSEYNFYTDEEIEPIQKPLIFGSSSLEEADEDIESKEDSDIAAAADELTDKLNSEKDETDAPATDDVEGELPEPPATDDVEGELPETEPSDDSNDVEVDVTSLVKGSEEAKVAADKATQNTEMLLQKLADLETKISSMDAIGNKISELEKELVKRNPTPVEKLEMRSLNSFPYSQKLTDYWAEKEGQYDVMGNENKPKEYILTQDEVDKTYSEPNIKKSFGVKPEDFEEEDI